MEDMTKKPSKFKTVMFYIILCSILISVAILIFAPNTETKKTPKLQGLDYTPPLSIEIVNKYGLPETLQGTDASYWYAYFKDGDFTIVTNKQTKTIVKVMSGRKPK